MAICLTRFRLTHLIMARGELPRWSICLDAEAWRGGELPRWSTCPDAEAWRGGTTAMKHLPWRWSMARGNYRDEALALTLKRSRKGQGS